VEEQRTIAKEFFLEGKGLQTGKPVRASFYPAEKNEGISFARKDLKGKPPISLFDPAITIDAYKRRSRIGLDEENYVETVEHTLAALWGSKIDNIKIELDNSELPALDGSAAKINEEIDKAGTEKQKVERKFIELKEPVWVEDEESFLGIFPSTAFKISFILEHPYSVIKRQFFSEVIGSEMFKKEISPARTLWLVPPGPGSTEDKAKFVQKEGYGRGADSKNTLIIDEKNFVNEPRFPDEPVKHNVLDLIGDLYLLGRPVKGRVIAMRSGHKLNSELVKIIKKRCL